MSVHRMPPRDDPFDPRLAALAHAGTAGELVGMGHVSVEIGRQNATLERIVAELANAVACGLVYVGDQVRLLQQVDAGPAPDADVTNMKRWAVLGRMVQALERIRDHEEHPGSGPPDDEMREIAREALRFGYPTSDEVPPKGLRVTEPQSPLVGAQVVGWDPENGGGVLVRASTGATYRIQVGMPFEIPAKIDWQESSWREFLRDQAAQIPDGVRAAAEELLAQFEHDSTAGWTLAGEHVTADVSGPLTSLADWLNQLGNVRGEVADGSAGD